MDPSLIFMRSGRLCDLSLVTRAGFFHVSLAVLLSATQGIADWARLNDGEIVEIVSKSPESYTVRTASGEFRTVGQ